MKKNIMQDNSISYNDKKDVLCSSIRDKAERSRNEKMRLKCYAIRNCNAMDEDDYFTWTMKICNKIYNMSNEEENTILNNQNTPDYLGFNVETDAVSYLIEADNLISENSMTINRNQDRNQDRNLIYSDSALTILSYLAEIRMDETLNETIPNNTLANCCSIDCYVDTTKIENDKEIKEPVLNECVICYETKEIKNFVTVNCGHNFCVCCIKRTINHSEELKCALCRTKIVSLQFRDKEICENF
jgi:hypothetical protein